VVGDGVFFLSVSVFGRLRTLCWLWNLGWCRDVDGLVRFHVVMIDPYCWNRCLITNSS